MNILIIGILGAVIAISLWLFLSMKAKDDYLSKSEEIGLPQTSGISDSIYHIISISGITFNKIFKFASSKGITVSEAMANMVDSWPETHYIIWRPEQMSASSVKINLIEKRLTASSTFTYEVKRILSTSTPNIGTFTYIPLAEELGNDNLYIEIECIINEVNCNTLPLIKIK